jgi:hypothetical protein
MENFDKYKIEIDGRWTLEDLYKFPRAYEQLYFAVEAMLPAEDEETDNRLTRTFQSFPWQGGYSAVNFYNNLKWATPKPFRPDVVSLKYASPGWIELYLQLPLAVQVASSIASIAASIGVCNRVYNAIYTDLQNRKLLRMERERKERELSLHEIRFLRESFDEMAGLMGLPNADEIHKRTNNPLVSMKILLSMYRRFRELAEFQNRGKADFTKDLLRRDKGEQNDLF